MAQRRFHYEQAFEHYLRSQRVPYVAVDEARKALLPADAPMPAIKSFDFVVYGDSENLLIDVKGRAYRGGSRFESWVTRDDVDALLHWQTLFGGPFRATFVFLYGLRAQPPDALFEQLISHAGRWYAMRQIDVLGYQRHMKQRSAKWNTVDLPAAAFHQLAQPLNPRPPKLAPVAADTTKRSRAPAEPSELAHV